MTIRHGLAAGPTNLRPELVIASSNSGKLAEFQALLGDQVVIRALTDLGIPSPAETGASFEENAELKARYLVERTGMVTLADDSGLEVDALNGLPGVRSARYAGEHQDDAENRALLVRNLADYPGRSRAARFVAVIAVVDAVGNLTLARGVCEGSIAYSERGSGGFGYDPIFELPDGRTLAELDDREKNAVSHRGQAIRHVLPHLREVLGLMKLEESAAS